MTNKLIILEDWVKKILVDPQGKGQIVFDEKRNIYKTDYGREFPVKNSIIDFRLLNNTTTNDQKKWKEGQTAFEEWILDYRNRDKKTDYISEIENMKEVYASIPIKGRCLDVGGFQGRLRVFLKEGQEYVCCDPIIDSFFKIEEQKNLLKAYECLKNPVNFICCDAEFLPFSSSSFDSVHMRSVIDHFLSPEQALLEAYRVLRKNGELIIGLTVTGGKSGKIKPKELLKDAAKSVLGGIGLKRFKDYHVWHPTLNELTDLVEKCGFQIVKEHWQKCCNDTVVYLLATKKDYLRRQG